jgi:putative flippase GtrA
MALRRFVLIGGIGFVVDAGILTALTRVAGWEPWHARLLSFPAAVFVTWWLNRQFTFAGRGLERRSVEALFYLGIQVIGAAINLAVFGACLAHWPELRSVPAVPLAAGAVVGLAFNFGVSNYVLYARRRAERQRTPPTSQPEFHDRLG